MSVQGPDALRARCSGRLQRRRTGHRAQALFGRWGDIREDPDAYCLERADPDDYDLVDMQPWRARERGRAGRWAGVAEPERVPGAPGGPSAGEAVRAVAGGSHSSDVQPGAEVAAEPASSDEDCTEEGRRASWRQARRVRIL